MQLAFMRALWELGEANVAQMQAQLATNGQILAVTTVATVLRRMEKKSWVAHRSEGRQFVYRAVLSQEKMGASVLSRITDALYGGNVGALLAQLIGSDSVDAADLAEVKRLIADKERRNG